MGVTNGTSRLTRTLLFVVLTLSVVLGLPQYARALTRSATIDDLKFSVYAPDWTWQKRDINILVILENTSEKPAQVRLNLVFPPGKEHHFGYDGERIIHLGVPGGKTLRHAFTNIVALDGVARQVYAFIYPDSHIVELDELRSPGILNSLIILQEMDEIYMRKMRQEITNF